MLHWILAAFLAIPFIEIAVFVGIGGLWGIWPTMCSILATAVIGLILIRNQGLAVWHQVQAEIAEEQFPARQIFSHFLSLFAGVLLLTPGLVTDAAGLVLLTPVTRNLVMVFIIGHVRSKGIHSVAHTIEGEFADTTGNSPPSSKINLPLFRTR